MLPYPKELRERVVAAVERGEHTINEIASIFRVGPTFVKRMLRLNRAGDDLTPRHGGGAERLLKEKELELLCQEVKNQPDVTLDELQKVLIEKADVMVSLPTICRALQEMNLPRKKKVVLPASVTKKNAKSSKK